MKRSDLLTVLPVHAAGAGVASAIMGVAGVVIFAPSMDAHAAEASAQNDVRRLVNLAVERRSQLRLIEERRDELRVDLDRGGVTLDPPEHLASRLGLLARLSEERDVTIMELTPGGHREHELCDIIEIQLSVTGVPSAITGLLGDIASCEQGIAVRSARIDAQSELASGWVSAELMLDWYASATERAADD